MLFMCELEYRSIDSDVSGERASVVAQLSSGKVSAN